MFPRRNPTWVALEENISVVPKMAVRGERDGSQCSGGNDVIRSVLLRSRRFALKRALRLPSGRTSGS